MECAPTTPLPAPDTRMKGRRPARASGGRSWPRVAAAVCLTLLDIPWGWGWEEESDGQSGEGVDVKLVRVSQSVFVTRRPREAQLTQCKPWDQPMSRPCDSRRHQPVSQSVFVTLRPLRGPANPTRAQGPKPCPSNATKPTGGGEICRSKEAHLGRQLALTCITARGASSRVEHLTPDQKVTGSNPVSLKVLITVGIRMP